MNWRCLLAISSGMIGNSLFYLSLISVVSVIPFGVQLIASASTSVAIIGAITILLAHLVNISFIPSLIADYKSKESYYDALVKLRKEDAFNIIYEFYILESDRGKRFINSLDRFILRNNIEPSIEKFIEVLGETKAAHVLSEIKYGYINNEKPVLRWVLTIGYIAGIGMLNVPAVIRVYSVLSS